MDPPPRTRLRLDGSGSGDADLWCREAHALGEGVDLADSPHRGEQLVHDAFGFVPLDGQVESAARFGEDGGTQLDNAEVSHSPAGPHIRHLNSPWFASGSGCARKSGSRSALLRVTSSPARGCRRNGTLPPSTALPT